MSKVAIVHPDLNAMGGAESVCLHFMNALKSNYKITLITFTEPKHERLKRFFNMPVAYDNIKILYDSEAYQWIYNRFSNFVEADRLARLDAAILNRTFSRLDIDADVYISTKNELNLPEPSVQYIHYPTFRPFSSSTRSGDTAIETLYERLCDAIGEINDVKLKNSTLVSNSVWMSNIVESIYETTVNCVYPPVDVLESNQTDWDSREDGFVCVGKIHKSKEILKIIRIIDRIIDNGMDTHLHIVGKKTDTRYCDRVFEMSKGRDYIFIENNMSRNKLIKLMRHHKFGLHGKQKEHFGMAVAEMVSSGMVAFVPASGGQQEVVRNIELLTYSNTDDAVNNISKVAKSVKLQTEILNSLDEGSHLNSSNEFQRIVRGIVDNKIERT